MNKNEIVKNLFGELDVKIGATIYSPDDYVPRKSVQIKFNIYPEVCQDFATSFKIEDFKNELDFKLNEVCDKIIKSIVDFEKFITTTSTDES